MAGGHRANEAHKRKAALRNLAIVVGCAALLFLFFIVSMNTGYIKLTPPDTLRILSGGGTDRENLILFDFRLPRIVLAILIGAGLALSGCIIQGISQNALADPGLLGINAGAGLMVILYVLFCEANSFLSIFTLPFLALAGAGAAACIIYVLASQNGQGIAPLSLILTGVGCRVQRRRYPLRRAAATGMDRYGPCPADRFNFVG